MENSARVIEFTVISGEDLRMDRRLIKKKALFTVVQTDAFNYLTTKADELGGSYPTWNEKLVIELPMHARFINLQVQCKASSSSSSSGNNNNNKTKSIGFAQIPVSDFIGGYVPENHLHFLSYRLRDAKGDKNGIINVSVRVKVPEYGTSHHLSKARLNVQGYASAKTYSSPAAALNVQGYASYSSPVGFGGPVGAVVTGVPVWCANRA